MLVLKFRRPMASPPTRPALRARYDRRQQEVVAIAARLFAERGYQATSMSDLIEATGLAAGGLYHYIGSKEQLLIMICDQLMEPLLSEARGIAAAEQQADLSLGDLIRAWVAHIESHRHHMLVFQQERLALERQPQWRKVRRQRKAFEATLEELLERAEGEGALAFPDRALVMRALLGMVNTTAQWLHPRGRLNGGQIADGYFELLVRAYG